MARWALALLFGAWIVALGVISAGYASDSVLIGPVHSIAMSVLLGAFAGSVSFLSRIAKSQEPDPPRAWRISLAMCVMTTFAFVAAFGVKGGIASSIFALSAAALTIAALRRSKRS